MPRMAAFEKGNRLLQMTRGVVVGAADRKLTANHLLRIKRHTTRRKHRSHEVNACTNSRGIDSSGHCRRRT